MSINYNKLHDHESRFLQQARQAFREYRQYFLDSKARVVDFYNYKNVTAEDIAEKFVNRVDEINKQIFAEKVFACKYIMLREKLFCGQVAYDNGYVQKMLDNMSWDTYLYYENFERLFAKLRESIRQIVLNIVFTCDLEKEYFITSLINDCIVIFDENLSFANFYLDNENYI